MPFLDVFNLPSAGEIDICTHCLYCTNLSRHMHSLPLLYQFESLTTFIWSIFWYNGHFWQRRVLKWIYYAIFIHFIFQRWQSLEHPSSLSRRNRHMRLLTFLYQIESLIIYLKRLFRIMHLFGSVQPKSESTLPYNLIFQKGQYLEPPGSPLGYTHMRPLTFLNQIESLTIFTWRIFWHNAYIWQHSALKWIYFAIFVHFITSKMAVWTKHGVSLHSGCSCGLVW